MEVLYWVVGSLIYYFFGWVIATSGKQDDPADTVMLAIFWPLVLIGLTLDFVGRKQPRNRNNE